MGFKLPQKTARLVFDGDYKGLEVVVRLNVPLGVYFQIEDLREAGKVGDLLALFANAALVSWNLEDANNGAIPANAGGLFQADINLAIRLIQEWQMAVVNPSDPLAGTSAGGSM